MIALHYGCEKRRVITRPSLTFMGPILRDKVICNNSRNLYRLAGKERRAKPCASCRGNCSCLKQRMSTGGRSRNDTACLVDQHLHLYGAACPHGPRRGRVGRLRQTDRFTIQNTARDGLWDLLYGWRRRRSCFASSTCTRKTRIAAASRRIDRSLIRIRNGVFSV